MNRMLLSVLVFVASVTIAASQTTVGQDGGSGNTKQPAKERNVEQPDTKKEQGPSTGLTKREQELLDRIENLERRLAELEARDAAKSPSERTQLDSTQSMPQMPGMPMP